MNYLFIWWKQENTHESLKKEIKIEKIDLYERADMRIGKIASSAEYQMDEQFQKSRNLWIFRFRQVKKFLIWKISRISN